MYISYPGFIAALFSHILLSRSANECFHIIIWVQLIRKPPAFNLLQHRYTAPYYRYNF